MQRSTWVNVLLGAAVAALGAWAYFKPAHDTRTGHPLSALIQAEARSIRIERAGEKPIVLEKRGGAWHLLAPFRARGNEARVRQLLELLEAQAQHKLGATDLGRFELDAPQARVTIAGQTFSFGMVNRVTREQYVQTGGAVYAISPVYGAAVPARPSDLVSGRLFGPGETPVSIDVGTFSVGLRGGKWRQTPPAPDLGQDDYLRWLEGWQQASAARVEPHAGGKPLGNIGVRLKDGGALTLGVLARDPELVLLRSDEKLEYHFRGEAAMRLLAPPGAAPREK